MKYVDARDAFFDALKPAKPARATLDAYRADLKMISELIPATSGSLQVEDLTRERLRRAFGVYAETRAAATILRVQGTWSKFFDFLVAEGFVEGNPMAAVGKPKRAQRQPKPLAGWEEGIDFLLLRALKDGCRKGRFPWPELDVAIVATLFASGLRAAELLALNIGSIEGRPPEQVIRVRKGKGQKDRAIAIEGSLDELLGVYLETRRERYPLWKPKSGDPLFVAARPAKDGKAGGLRMSYGQLEYLLETALASAGFSNARQAGTLAHAFRHTFGTVLAANGARVTVIRELMGHTSLNTTQGYIDSVGRDQRDDASRNTVYAALAKLTEGEPDQGM